MFEIMLIIFIWILLLMAWIVVVGAFWVIWALICSVFEHIGADTFGEILFKIGFVVIAAFFPVMFMAGVFEYGWIDMITLGYYKG